MNPAAYIARVAERSVGLGTAVACSTSSDSYSPNSSFIKVTNRFGGRWEHHRTPRGAETITIFQLTDHLHDGRTACVSGDEIAATVSTWLAELGAHSPLADDLAHAVRGGDWPTAYAIGEHLSVDVAVCAECTKECPSHRARRPGRVTQHVQMGPPSSWPVLEASSSAPDLPRD